jgi:hypothetical protein
MTTRNIIEGLQTLMPFYDKPDGYHVGAEHDVIYGYATDKPLTPEALAKMIELGWHQEYDERDYDEDFSAADYRPDEGWHAYT